MNIQVRQARLPDWDSIKHFLDQAYGALAYFKGSHRWNWQFVTNPFQFRTGELAPVWIALDQQGVVGQIAVQPARLQLGKEEYPAGWIVDVMILPSHRGLGLGHRLYDAVTASVPLSVTLTMAPATRRMALRAGCVTLGPARQYVRLVRLTPETVRRFLLSRTEHRPWLQAWARIACDFLRIHRWGTATINTWLRAGGRSRTPGSDPQTMIKEVRAFGAEIDQFWDRVRHDYPAIFVRSSQFLNWRFVNPPDLQYRCFIASRSAQCVGYMVLRSSTPEELPAGFIVDFLVARDDMQTIEAFLARATEVFGTGVAAIDCVTSSQEVGAILRKNGFHPVRTVHATVVCQDRMLRSQINQLRDCWYFTKGDHDWDQIHLA